MGIVREAYIHSAAGLEELRTFLRRSVNLGEMPLNWLHGRLDDWACAGKDLSTFYADNVHLWRHSSGTLVGFCIAEGPGDSIYLQVHPAQREIEGDMLRWVEQAWAGPRDQIEVYAWAHDEHRRTLLAAAGYEHQGECGREREYDLNRDYPQPALPDGFALRSLAEGGNVAGRIRTESLTFGSEQLNAAWYAAKSSAPGYDAAWDWGLMAPSGDWVSFALAWPDFEYGVAEIDPVGTHPDHRQRGFASAVLCELFRQLRAAGLQRAYIGSGGEPNPSNRLYDSLGPARRWVEEVWRKKLHPGEQHD